MKLPFFIQRNKKLLLISSIFATSALYYGVIVNPEYQSTSSFVVKEISAEQSINTGLGLLTPNGMNKTAPMIMDYVQSQAMAEEIYGDPSLNFKEHVLRHATPVIGVEEASPSEKFYREISRLTNIEIDATSNVYTLSTSAYDPDTAKSLNDMMMKSISSLINSINRETAKAKRENAESIAKDVKSELDAAEQELKAFQRKSNSISPIADIEMAAETISILKEKLVEFETEYDSKVNFLSDRHPDMQQLLANIEAVEAKLEAQRKISVSIPDIDTFNDLRFNVEMLTKGYQVAMATSLKEKSEASKEGLVLLKISPAHQPEEISYPRFFYHTINMTLIVTAILWLLSMLAEATRKGRRQDKRT